ncbi:MAG: PIG-L family deacetylase [Chitinophagales bacterium]|nr:PIG-L family deacetylase [Chitinophagales bacterium]MDW8419371.1 PIG-L family deacetylase [Chitinophagales bacterium]
MNLYNKILVLAPHTDDGELGCGSSIHKFVQEGKDVYYVAFSICSKSLPPDVPGDTLAREVQRATSVLGIPKKNLIMYDFDVRDFPAQRQQILEEMVKINKDIKPDLVFQPSSNDLHQDHQVIYMEGLRAFKTTTILGYELPWNNLTFTTNAFIKLNEENVYAKISALKEYKSQSHRHYLNDAFIKGLAQTRGTQAGVNWAEAFEVIRWIIN